VILGKTAIEKMLAGLSTRRYPVGLDPVGEQVAEKYSATSKSAVSRKFVAMTETALGELLAADLARIFDLISRQIYSKSSNYQDARAAAVLNADIERALVPPGECRECS
jgi:putative transposase